MDVRVCAIATYLYLNRHLIVCAHILVVTDSGDSSIGSVTGGGSSVAIWHVS